MLCTLKSCSQHMVFSCLNQFRRRCSTTSSTAPRRLRRRHLRHTSYGTLHRRCFGIRLSLMGAFGSKMIMRIDTDRYSNGVWIVTTPTTTTTSIGISIGIRSIRIISISISISIIIIIIVIVIIALRVWCLDTSWK